MLIWLEIKWTNHNDSFEWNIRRDNRISSALILEKPIKSINSFWCFFLFSFCFQFTRKSLQFVYTSSFVIVMADSKFYIMPEELSTSIFFCLFFSSSSLFKLRFTFLLSFVRYYFWCVEWHSHIFGSCVQVLEFVVVIIFNFQIQAHLNDCVLECAFL